MARELIIDDFTPDRHLFPADRGRGLDLTSRPSGYAHSGTAEPFPVDLVIPRADWQAMIAEQEARKVRIPDFCDLMGVKVKDQQQTNFCWCNAPVHCVEILRAVQNEPHVSLSPASVACQINGFVNEGGNGIESLRFIAAHGVVPDSLWPDNAIAKQYATAPSLAAARNYRVDQWWELEPNNLDQLISVLLMRIPVSVGLDWWGHQVTYVAPRWIDGAIAVEIDNSWGQGWGTNGRGVLQGRRILPDDATAPRVAVAA